MGGCWLGLADRSRRMQDGPDGAIEVLQNNARREPQDADAAMAEPFVARDVMPLPIPQPMLLAVDLNGEPNGVAIEVQDEGSDGVLPAEAKAVSLPPQVRPKPHLWRRHPPTKRAGALDRAGWGPAWGEHCRKRTDWQHTSPSPYG